MIPRPLMFALNPYAWSVWYWKTVADAIPTATPEPTDTPTKKAKTMPTRKGAKTPVIVTLNVGSSSVKFSIVAPDTLEQLAVGKVSGIGGTPELDVKDTEHAHRVKESVKAEAITDALQAVMKWIGENETDHTLVAVAHRIVHGGPNFNSPCIATPKILADLEKLIPFTPLHQPYNIAGVRAMQDLAPHVPQILCFDTAFHSDQPSLHTLLPLPKELREQGIRRYGFHGLAYESVVTQLEQNRPDLLKKRLVCTQLGNGSSACSIVNGKSVATTMGLTVLGGLPMGTRPGDMDPGAVLYLTLGLGMKPEEVQKMLYSNSGLKGLSGISSDVKILLDTGGADAGRAMDYYVLKTAQAITAMAVAGGGMDALVFSGGIGENATPVREAILDRLKPVCAPFEVLVVPADEEAVLARYAAKLAMRKAA